MKLLILGATGPTGGHVVEQALRAGDTVTVLARNPKALSSIADQVTIFQGDATIESDVDAAMQGQDAVISALGAGRSLVSDVYPRAAAAVIASATASQVARLVWISSFGVGDTFSEASLLQKFIYSTLLRSIYSQKVIADALVRSSGLDWTIVYPTALTNGPATGTFRIAEHLRMKGNPSISRADVAAFMLDAARGSEWIGRSAVVSD